MSRLGLCKNVYFVHTIPRVHNSYRWAYKYYELLTIPIPKNWTVCALKIDEEWIFDICSYNSCIPCNKVLTCVITILRKMSKACINLYVLNAVSEDG